MRTLSLTIGLLVAGGAGLAAQDLKRPADWMVRFDNASATEADLETFVEMPPGWHVTSGPAGIYWDPAMVASGDFRVEMEVYLFDPGTRREAFGIFIGGRELSGDAQAYTYFLLRNGGEFLLKRRDGAATPTIQGWTAHDAVASYEDRAEGDVTIKNVLAIEVGAEEVHFFVNDVQVASVDRADLSVEGIVGFRVNHGLNLHISSLELVPATAP